MHYKLHKHNMFAEIFNCISVLNFLRLSKGKRAQEKNGEEIITLKNAHNKNISSLWLRAYI